MFFYQSHGLSFLLETITLGFLAIIKNYYYDNKNKTLRLWQCVNGGIIKNNTHTIKNKYKKEWLETLVDNTVGQRNRKIKL